MNRERAKELLHIIEAFANGEDIQRQFQITIDPDKFEWNVTDFIEGAGKYRIKPKPREWWIGDPDKNELVRAFRITDEKQFSYLKDREQVIKVREVLDEDL